MCSEQQIAETNAKSSDGLRYFQDGDNIARRVRVLQFPGSWSQSGGGEESRQVRHRMLEFLGLRELSRMVLFHVWIIFQLQLHFALSYKSYKHRP